MRCTRYTHTEIRVKQAGRPAMRPARVPPAVPYRVYLSTADRTEHRLDADPPGTSYRLRKGRRPGPADA